MNNYSKSLKTKLHTKSRKTYFDLRPRGRGKVTVWTLEGVRVYVRPLVVLHVRASVEGLHADATGKPFSVETW